MQSYAPCIEAIRQATASGLHRRAFSLYLSFLRSGHRPCPFSLASTLKSISHLPLSFSPSLTSAFHSHLIRLGLLFHPYPFTALSHLYSLLLSSSDICLKLVQENPFSKANVVCWNNILSSCLRAGNLKFAQEVFDEMPMRDVVSYNSMISGLGKAGRFDEASEIFWHMSEKDSASWNALISGYILHGKLTKARELFDKMPTSNNISCVTMISAYSKAGDVASSYDIFETMGTNDIFVWNAMISCYSQNGCAREAIHLFNRMRKPEIGLIPNEKTFSCVISACAQISDLRFGLWIQGYIGHLGIELDDHLMTALLDLYSKCGGMNRAVELFNRLSRRDVVSYSAMILGCGINGMLAESISLFKEMLVLKIRPNGVTFIALLTGYNHAGLVDEARECFDSMYIVHKIKPIMDHYTIMVDILARNGRLRVAHELIDEMPMQPHVSVWGAFLLGCRLHRNVKFGEIAARNCFELAPDEAGYYVLLANIYTETGKWDEARKLRTVMAQRGLNKISGNSWVHMA